MVCELQSRDSSLLQFRMNVVRLFVSGTNNHLEVVLDECGALETQ